MNNNKINKTLLLILDGFGNNPSKIGNAIKQANTPNIDNFFASNAVAQLETSGMAVGLAKGIMGNSEVGHLNIGAGRIVFQLNTMITKSISDGDFFHNNALNNAIEHSKKHNSKLHLFGLLSDGNVHSNDKHLWELLKLAKQANLEEVYYHAFMDGRDTLPSSGINFMQEFEEKAKEIGIGKIATISGRYYAMDRDNRWDRVKRAYDAIANSEGKRASKAIPAIKASYENNITDEFIEPTVITENNLPIASVSENDSIIFFNFRSDRAREITRCFIEPDFSEFEVNKYSNLKFVTFSEYAVKFNNWAEAAFRSPKLTNILGEVISNNNLKQLRLAETEKYAHVTFFFNGGSEEPFPNEERILIPSPSVATYDLKPEMSAIEVKDQLVNALNSNKHDLIITNFANCDMVGHTGIMEAAIKAVETIDACLGEIVIAAKQNKVNILLTADHGNAEKMLDENNNVFTAHSLNTVPIAISCQKPISLKDGTLADIAPTILSMMNLQIPEEMTGKILINDEPTKN